MRTKACPECDGRGYEKCDLCGGSGTTSVGGDCYKCKGTGKIECDFCEGEGYVEEDEE